MKIRPVGPQLLQANRQTDERIWRSQQPLLTILRTRLKIISDLRVIINKDTLFGWNGKSFKITLSGAYNLLNSEYPVSFPKVKRPELGVDHPPPWSSEVKGRVELYLYSSSEPSCPLLEWTLLLPLNLPFLQRYIEGSKEALHSPGTSLSRHFTFGLPTTETREPKVKRKALLLWSKIVLIVRILTTMSRPHRRDCWVGVIKLELEGGIHLLNCCTSESIEPISTKFRTSKI